MPMHLLFVILINNLAENIWVVFNFNSYVSFSQPKIGEGGKGKKKKKLAAKSEKFIRGTKFEWSSLSKNFFLPKIEKLICKLTTTLEKASKCNFYVLFNFVHVPYFFFFKKGCHPDGMDLKA